MRTLRWRSKADDDDEQPSYEPHAANDGRPISPRPYRHNKGLRFGIYGFDSLIPEPQSPPERSRLHWLRRRFSALMAGYRMSGMTPTQLRTIEALMIQSKTLRQFAREEGVSPQAIDARIEALKYVAPEFWQFWLWKNRRRRYARRRR